MTTEERRLVIAEVLVKTRTNHGWVFSPDHKVPSSARLYAVFDGAELKGAGLTVERVQQVVDSCVMPIVLYLPAEDVPQPRQVMEEA